MKLRLEHILNVFYNILQACVTWFWTASMIGHVSFLEGETRFGEILKVNSEPSLVNNEYNTIFA